MKITNRYIEIAQVFFKLGLFAFGGPAAHVAMMEEEIVTKDHKRIRLNRFDLFDDIDE